MSNNKMTFVGAFLAGALLLGGASAHAWQIRRAHANCEAFQSTNFRIDGGNNGTSGSLMLGCPFPDENDLPHQNITTVNAHFERPSGTSSSGAARCVQFPFASGGSCAGGTFTSGTGFVTVSPTGLPSGWSDAGNFAYLNVIIAPKNSSGAITKYKGFFATNEF